MEPLVRPRLGGACALDAGSAGRCGAVGECPHVALAGVCALGTATRPEGAVPAPTSHARRRAERPRARHAQRHAHRAALPAASVALVVTAWRRHGSGSARRARVPVLQRHARRRADGALADGDAAGRRAAACAAADRRRAAARRARRAGRDRAAAWRGGRGRSAAQPDVVPAVAERRRRRVAHALRQGAQPLRAGGHAPPPMHARMPPPTHAHPHAEHHDKAHNTTMRTLMRSTTTTRKARNTSCSVFSFRAEQVSGVKHVLLWPPEALPHLHLYPATHVAHRQSQMVLVPTEAEARDGGGISVAVGPNGDVTAAAGAAGAAAGGGWQPLPPLPTYSGAAVAAVRRVSLRPGELLYIPPYHPHAVYGDAPSVSLASFSDSWEQARCFYPHPHPPHAHACSPDHYVLVPPPPFSTRGSRRAGRGRAGSARRSAASAGRPASARAAPLG